MLWINGQVSQGDKLILDEGLLYGRGVFETIHVGRVPYFWTEHLARLNTGLSVLNISRSIDPQNLLYQVKELNIQHCVLKIIATSANLILQTRPLPTEPRVAWRLTVAPGGSPANAALTQSKNLNYLDHLLTRETAREAGYDDAILIDNLGWLKETTRTNVFFVKEGQLLTPGLSAGILDGIVRQWVIHNFPASEGLYQLDDILAADEAFVTNSVIGIQAIGQIGSRSFSSAETAELISRKYAACLSLQDQAGFP
jgi:4-amino-4-deoxychorismate lyase